MKSYWEQRRKDEVNKMFCEECGKTKVLIETEKFFICSFCGHPLKEKNE